MREIKFRGLSNQGWVYGDLISSPNGMIKYVQTDEPSKIGDFQKFINQKSLAENGCYFTNKCIEVDPETVGEFTGRKDMNGTEIYEGDLLRTQTTYIATVKWDIKFSGFRPFICEDMWNYDPFEVIGNIHQDEELLND